MNGAQQDSMVVSILAIMVAVVTLVVMLVFLVAFGSLFFSWLRAFTGGAPVMLFDLIGMKLRRVPPGLIVDELVALVQRGRPHDRRNCSRAQRIYLARCGQIHSSQELADLLEKDDEASRGPVKPATG